MVSRTGVSSWPQPSSISRRAWNDPKAGKKGVSPQSADERKAGHARYIELKAAMVARKQKALHSHFGFTPEQMDPLAAEGIK